MNQAPKHFDVRLGFEGERRRGRRSIAWDEVRH
jgi:hypothetical protein